MRGQVVDEILSYLHPHLTDGHSMCKTRELGRTLSFDSQENKIAQECHAQTQASLRTLANKLDITTKTVWTSHDTVDSIKVVSHRLWELLLYCRRDCYVEHGVKEANRQGHRFCGPDIETDFRVHVNVLDSQASITSSRFAA